MNLLHLSAVALLALLLVLVVVAAIRDVRTRTIANGLNLTIALLALPWWFVMGLDGWDVAWQVASATVILILFAACFAIGMMGGGDVKLLVALALWFPATELVAMLIWMAIGGGLLTVAMLIQHRLARSQAAIEVPYGVAIAGATVLVVANHILTIPAA